MNYYIGMDLGTSGVKGVLFDIKGNIIKSVLKEYDIISPLDGYAEEDPAIWLDRTVEALKELSDFEFKDSIKGLGFSGQMHGLVLLDKDDNILRYSIIWWDNSTDQEAKEIENVNKKLSGIDEKLNNLLTLHGINLQEEFRNYRGDVITLSNKLRNKKKVNID